MLAIARREISSFLSSPAGYLIMGLFLSLSGLFLWVLKGPYNIFDFGFAELGAFFLIAPWLLLLLVPALAMKSFAEEFRSGTMELLYIKPVTLWQITLGKFAGVLALLLLAILPTVIYTFSLSSLATDGAVIDWGQILGSYFGLFFLAATYTAAGIYASSLTENQIVAFLLGIGFCFILMYGPHAISELLPSGDFALRVKNLGLWAHFESMARGVMDTRDLLYFGSLAVFILFLTVLQLKNRNR